MPKEARLDLMYGDCTEYFTPEDIAEKVMATP